MAMCVATVLGLDLDEKKGKGWCLAVWNPDKDRQHVQETITAQLIDLQLHGPSMMGGQSDANQASTGMA